MIRNHRLNDFTAALRARHVELVGFLLNDQAGGFHIGPQLLAALEAVQAGIGTAVGVDARLAVENADHLKVETLADGVIVGIVGRGDFERTGAELAIDVVVGDNRHRAVEDGHQHLAADEMPVTLVLRVDGHGGIAQDGFWARGGHRDEFIRVVRQTVLEVIQETRFLRILHLEVRDGGAQAGRPVDHARAAVDQALLVQAHESLAHSARQPGVEREALPRPVARGAQTADLAGDDAAVLLLPGPGAPLELLAAKLVAGEAFFGQRLLHLELGGDAGVVGAGQPQGGFTFHAVVADHQVFHRHKHGVP